MKKDLSVLHTDGVIDRTLIPASAIFDAYRRSWRDGWPLLMSHDVHRPVGWTRLIGVHIAPDAARLLGLMLLPDTREETELIQAAHRRYVQHVVSNETAQSIEDLRAKLAPYLTGDEKHHYQNSPVLISKDLARRAASEVFSLADKDGLVPLKALQSIRPGIYQIKDGLVLFAHPSFRRALSRLNRLNVEFLQTLESIAQFPETRVLVKLDPDAVGLADVREHFEYEYWWGPKFDDDLTSIPPGVTRHESDERQRTFSGVSRTEFWWQSRANDRGTNEHILEIEELRDRPTFASSEISFGCRYVHSIVNDASRVIEHLDGSIRQYTEEQILRRLDQKLSEAGRHTEYSKLWRVDGRIPLPLWKNLIHHYFRDNPLVGEYLGADRAKDLASRKRKATAPDLLKQLVPYSMQERDGIRFLISVSDTPTPYPNDLFVVPNWTVGPMGVPCLPDEIIDIQKLLLRQGVRLSLPINARFLACADGYHEFPLVVSRDARTLSATLDAFRRLLRAWAENRYDAVVALNIGRVDSEGVLRLGIVGCVSHVAAWLNNQAPFPPTDENEFSRWVDDARNFLRSFQAESESERLFATVTEAGVVAFERTRLRSDQLEFERRDDGVIIRLSDRSPELSAILDDRRATIQAAWFVRAWRCGKCSTDYRSCPCVAFVDNGVERILSPDEMAFVFWTDRPLSLEPA